MSVMLEVNDLGFFLEIEILLPFDAPEYDVAAAGKGIRAILSKCGADEAAIESRSYRDMILRR